MVKADITEDREIMMSRHRYQDQVTLVQAEAIQAQGRRVLHPTTLVITDRTTTLVHLTVQDRIADHPIVDQGLAAITDRQVVRDLADIAGHQVDQDPTATAGHLRVHAHQVAEVILGEVVAAVVVGLLGLADPVEVHPEEVTNQY